MSFLDEITVSEGSAYACGTQELGWILTAAGGVYWTLGMSSCVYMTDS